MGLLCNREEFHKLKIKRYNTLHDSEGSLGHLKNW